MAAGITRALFSSTAFAFGPGKAVLTFGKASLNDMVLLLPFE
jgi:hypothetical protein